MNNPDNQEFLNIDSTLYKTRLSRKYRNRQGYMPVNPMLILSYIPGTVLDIYVTPGAAVKPGDDLMILEAMKMKNRIKCHAGGKVKSVSVKTGDKVSKGTVLIELE